MFATLANESFVPKWQPGRVEKPKYPNRLGELLRERQLSNHDLAEMMGVTDATVSRWVSGKRGLENHMTQMARILRLKHIGELWAPLPDREGISARQKRGVEIIGVLEESAPDDLDMWFQAGIAFAERAQYRKGHKRRA